MNAVLADNEALMIEDQIMMAGVGMEFLSSITVRHFRSPNGGQRRLSLEAAWDGDKDRGLGGRGVSP